MPELPEVEGMRRRTAGIAIGRCVRTVELLDPALMPEGEALKLSLLEGRRVEAVTRRGKQIALRMGDLALVLHPRMTGRLGAPHPGRVRLRASLDSGEVLVFTDARRLGRARLVDERARSRLWEALGPEPWPEVRDGVWWAARMAGARGPIKPALMEQWRVAGVGNIGATEACWHARLAPWRPVPSLCRAEWDGVARGILSWITVALQQDGAGAYIAEGGANPFGIYGRVRSPCPRCGAQLAARRLRGRGSVYCPACQR